MALAHLLQSYDIGDQLDDIASADPPAYLRRCFAEAASTAHLSRARVQQLAVCAMVVDAVVADRDYPGLEPELIADWRAHHAAAFAGLREPARQALEHALGQDPPTADTDSIVELRDLAQRLAAG